MRLVHLDTSFLMDLRDTKSIAGFNVAQLLSQDGTVLGASAIAWMEFLRGPKDVKRNPAERDYARKLLKEGITPFFEEDADQAGHLFNLLGRPSSRKDKLRMDCLIAATAIQRKAELATTNLDDFKLFEPHGLNLVKLEEPPIAFHV